MADTLQVLLGQILDQLQRVRHELAQELAGQALTFIPSAVPGPSADLQGPERAGPARPLQLIHEELARAVEVGRIRR